MVPSDLAAGNATGGQLPIHTTEREHEVCVCKYVCLFVFTSCLRVSLCVPVFGCVVGTPISVFSVLGLLQPSKNVHVDANMYTCFGWMRDINKSTA